MKLRQSGITFIITVLLYSGVSILYKTAYGDNNESCFSSENFDIIRNYLAAEIKKDVSRILAFLNLRSSAETNTCRAPAAAAAIKAGINIAAEHDALLSRIAAIKPPA